MKFNPPNCIKNQREKRKVDLYVDINIGKGKKGRIGLKQGDNILKTAENFCKTYDLNKQIIPSLCNNLTQALQNHLLSKK